MPTDTAALATLRWLASAEITVEEVAGAAAGATGTRPAVSQAAALHAARFGEPVLDTRWRRTSYTALTTGSGAQAGVASEPEETGTDDEAEIAVPSPAAGDPPADTPAVLPSPLADLPMGAGFGTVVHAVLEVAELAAADLQAELTARCAEQLRRGPVPGLQPGALAAALVPVVRTPLGPLTGGRRLADIGPADRLAELEFELPLAGGDRAMAAGATAGGTTAEGGGPAPEVTLGDLAPLLRRHLPAADPLHGYPAALAEPGRSGRTAVARLPDRQH